MADRRRQHLLDYAFWLGGHCFRHRVDQSPYPNGTDLDEQWRAGWRRAQAFAQVLCAPPALKGARA
jgi:hypothetical protein